MEWHDFGQKVRKRREELGISQQEIATALGIDQAKVSLIERGGRKVDLVKEVPALAKILRCPISYLCDQELDGQNASDDPVKALVSQYFPNVDFNDMELKRIRQFLEPVLASFVENSDMKKQAQ